ncbi:MAG: adenylate/guanylate cyclase domain-containing protein [Campylobacterales bacterium]|nr:adenylate/guanylate cyclase domain-containing protein [Campylobacterales bacterium]
MNKNLNKQLKRFLYYFLTSMLIASLAFVFKIKFKILTDPFEYKLQDYMFKLRGPIKDSGNVVIVDIDEKSLNKLGQWPWSRDKVAKIIENLTLAEVAVIGLDIVFAEQDQSSPAKVLKDFGIDNIKLPDYDEMFIYTVMNSPTILGYQFILDDNIPFIEKEDLNIPLIVIEKGNIEWNYVLNKAVGTVLNYKQLQNSAYSSGFINNVPDESGIVRSVPLVIKYDDRYFPSLSLDMLIASSGLDKIFINYDNYGMQSVRIGELEIPTDRHGNLMVNFRGPRNTFKYYSAIDIYDGDFDRDLFKDKVILIGTTAAGLFDLRAIPYDSVFPGVEIHANIIDNILIGDFLNLPIWIDGFNVSSLYIIAFLVMLFIIYFPLYLKPLSIISLLFLTFYLNYYLLFEHGIVSDLFMPILLIIVSSIIFIFIDFFVEVRKKHIIKKKFASKVSKEVMDDLLLNVESDHFSVKEKEVTIFFSDVRNFTSISESMPDPITLIEFMNEYMDPMTEIIIEQKGTVDKFIGDAIMAYWNAPWDIDNHADRAVHAALNQLYKLKELNEKISIDPRYQNTVKMCEEKGIPILDIGVGINTGDVIVGEMGSSKRSDYTIIGNAVNLGSRLESLCKFYGSKCNISNYTKEQLNDSYIYMYLDTVTVKGQNNAVEIWQVIDFDKPDNNEKLYSVSREKLDSELKGHSQAIDMYKNGNFKVALERFQILNQNENKINKNIYDIYIQRCERYIENPPVNFDGVFKHTTKG